MLKTENHIPILIVFFLVIIIIIPGSVLYWINTSKRYDKSGVLQDNAELYLKVINENLNLKRCLFMVAMSLEFQDMSIPRSEANEISKLRSKYLEYIPKRLDINPRILKIMLLLIAHMHRRPVNKSLKKDTDFIVTNAINMIEFMLDTAFFINMVPRAKKMSIRTFTMLIEFAQLLTQGIMMHDSNAYMLPNINESHLKFFGNKKKPKISEIKELPDLKKIQEKLSATAFEDFKAVLNHLPELKVTAEAYVDGEAGITEGDLVTVKIIIERLKLKEGEKVGFIHSNCFDMLRLEKLWIIIADPMINKVLYLKSVLSQERVIENSEFKFPIGGGAIKLGVGKHKWEVHVKSDCYYGIDVVVPLEFEVLQSNQVKKEVFVHPDDQKIEKQSTWIQSMMAGMKADDSSEEEEEVPELVDEEEIEDIIDS